MTMEYVAVARANEIEPGAMKLIEIEGNELVLANVNGDFFAFSGKCTCLSHFAGYQREAGDTTLADGALTGATVTCSVHGTVYDVRDGAPLNGPGEAAVNTYEVKNYRGELRIAKMTDSERRFWNAA